ncbi:MAG TPA: TIM-barrel domain-containing protein [Blastocatellia bacterium]|nr:TIM-barrel domain-containing protein [Blastocatellia bacterium]
MSKKLLSRRDVVRGFGLAGAGLLSTRLVPAGDQRPIRIGDRSVEIAIREVSRFTVRISIVPLEGGRPKPIETDGSLVQQFLPPPRARFSNISKGETIRVGDMLLNLTFDPLVIAIETKDKPSRRVQELRIDQHSGSMSFLPGDKPLLGLGEGGPQFDRRGSVDQMRSGQGGYRLRTHGGRVPIQWLIGAQGWAMFIHSPLGTFDFRGTESRFDPGSSVSSLPLDFFIVSASDPAQIMSEYARLTGYPEMPPLWSLGYQQSHRTLGGPDEIRQVARTFREKNLPCDALIYLGTGFTPSGWNTYNGEFIWNPKNFPDPRKMIDELHAQHFKVVLHIVLEGRRLTGAVSDRCTAAPLPSGRTPDNQWPNDRQVSCYWPVHKQLYDAGIDGWWPDQGDGLDAPSRLARNRMYWDGSQQLRPNERPYALHRNGFAGMQRYASFLWSGDVYTTWETLRTHVSVAINTGLSGIPYWGTDIGGFVPTKEYTGELHIRWFQFGAFCPLFRAHGRTWHLRLPWGWNTGELGIDEIANYTGGAANPDPSELHNPNVEPICRKYLELRYRLMPYLYSVVREGHQTGLPIIRALWLHYPDDDIAVARGDEYLWGRDILVAPVTEKGARSRRLYLPRGLWYDFWTEAKAEGAHEIDHPVDLATMPLFVRAGAIVPMGPIRQYTGEKVDRPLSLSIYPGADGAFTLYEDDGTTFDYRKGELMKLALVWNDRRRLLTLRLSEGSKMLPPLRRNIEIRVVPNKAGRTVVFEGKMIEVRF